MAVEAHPASREVGVSIGTIPLPFPPRPSPPLHSPRPHLPSLSLSPRPNLPPLPDRFLNRACAFQGSVSLLPRGSFSRLRYKGACTVLPLRLPLPSRLSLGFRLRTLSGSSTRHCALLCCLTHTLPPLGPPAALMHAVRCVRPDEDHALFETDGWRLRGYTKLNAALSLLVLGLAELTEYLRSKEARCRTPLATPHARGLRPFYTPRPTSPASSPGVCPHVPSLLLRMPRARFLPAHSLFLWWLVCPGCAGAAMATRRRR